MIDYCFRKILIKNGGDFGNNWTFWDKLDIFMIAYVQIGII